jgi:hypothetical protein
LGVYSAVIHYAHDTPHEVPHYYAVHSYFSGLRGITAPFLATGLLAVTNYYLALGAALLGTAAGTTLLWSRVRAPRYAEGAEAIVS